MSVYITGDCHADFSKFSIKNFPEQKKLNKNDYMIICGDFGGIWNWSDNASEIYWLKWLDNKKYTTLFIDGNHENFDRLNRDFEIVQFNGGKAHKISNSIYHLMRGYIFELCDKSFFAFGGGKSHDIKDGILNFSDYGSAHELIKDYNRLTKHGKMVRINHVSWWKEEMPNKNEMNLGRRTLKENNNKVNYIISHCAPSNIVNKLSQGLYKPDKLTEYFEEINREVQFDKWFFGHYHDDKNITDNHILLYDNIIKLV